MIRIKKNRKGQFFVISAVVVIMILLSLNAILNQAWVLESAETQADKSFWVIAELQRGVETIAEGSAAVEDEVLEAKLETFFNLWKSSLAPENFFLKADYNVTASAVVVDLVLQSERAVLKKSIFIMR